MQFQGIVRRNKKVSSVINAEKKRKTTDWKRLEISSRKLEILKITFHAKMGTIKDRKDTDLTEAEHIEKRWQDSHQDSMVLAQKQKYRSMEQNRKPRDKFTYLRTPYLQQSRQEYTMEKKTTSLTSGAGKTGQPLVKE